MPRHITVHAPDWIDVNSQLTALGEDFGCLCEFITTVERDYVITTARCRVIAGDPFDAIVAQARSQRPLKSKPDLAIICFALAQDCWRQLDSGNAAIAPRATPTGWDGRPQIARRQRGK